MTYPKFVSKFFFQILFITNLLIASIILSQCAPSSGYNTPWEREQLPSQADQAPASINDVSRTIGYGAQHGTRDSEGLDDQSIRNSQGFFDSPDIDLATAPYNHNHTQNMEFGHPPVKVGLLLPLSGPAGTLGQALLKGAQMALFEIGVRNLELVPRDTQGTPEGSREAARALLGENVQIIIGPVFADSVRAAKSVLSGSNINMLVFSTDWTLAGGNTFIMGFLPFDQVERITRYAAGRNLQRIGLIAPNSPYGQVVSAEFRDESAMLGVITTNTVTYSEGLTPRIEDIQRFSQIPTDAVLIAAGGQEAVTTSAILSQFDLPPQSVVRLGTGLWDDPSLASNPDFEGALFAAPPREERENFERRFISLYGMTPPRLTSLAYDALALTAVLTHNGQQNTGRPAFDKASLTNPNGFSGIDGIFRFRSNHMAERGLAVLQFQRGRIVTADPAPQTFETQEMTGITQ